MYTKEQKKAISVAYLLSGNSPEDLATQLVETLMGTDEASGAFEQFFEESEQDMIQARVEQDDIVTTVEDELTMLENLYERNKYSSTIWE